MLVLISEAILSMPSKGSLSVLLSSNRKHIMTDGSTNASRHKWSQMLTEAECFCAKLSMAIFLAKCVDSCQKQTSNNLPTLQTCSNPSTCICVHHGIQILPRGQRGIRIDQHATTSFDDKRHTATQEQTHASQQGMVDPEVGRDRTEIIGKSYIFMIFPEKVLNST